MVNVIIIGAGAAGLAAASRLVEKGLNPTEITILEAENRIGGRIHTVQHGSSIIEMGAQWVHGKHGNVVHPLAEAAGEIRTDLHTLESTGYSDNVETCYKDGRKISPSQLKEFKDVLQNIYDSSKLELSRWNGSLGDYFHKKFIELLDQGKLRSIDRNTAMDLLDWAHRSQNIEDGSDNWFETCGSGSLEYYECVGDYTTVWRRGYSTLFDILMRNIPKSKNGMGLPLSDRIHLNSPVTRISWNDGHPHSKIQVTTNDRTYETDLLLVTCSLGVLKEKANKLFVPPLPEKKTKAIKGLGFGSVGKIFLEFRKPWWSPEWGGVNFLAESSKANRDWEEQILGFFTLRDQPNLLIGWIGGSSAREFESTAETEALSRCSALLRKAVGEGVGYEEPIRLIRSTWYSNPNFRGSYSYRSTRSKELDVWASDLAEPVADSKGSVKLFFAGEATHEHHYSNVHAAVETGWREADRILNVIKELPLVSKL